MLRRLIENAMDGLDSVLYGTTTYRIDHSDGTQTVIKGRPNVEGGVHAPVRFNWSDEDVAEIFGDDDEK